MAIEFDKGDREEWARIIGLTESDLSYLYDKIQSSTEYPVDSVALIDLVEDGLPANIDDRRPIAAALAKNLVRLAGLQIEEPMHDLPLQMEISKALRASGISPAGLDRLSETWSTVVNLANLEQFGLAYKASDLLFDHESSFLDVRVITDLRPVFSIDGTKIVGSVAVNTLKIEYIRDDEVKLLSVAVDQNDLKKLQRVAEYAEEKTAETINFFSAKIGNGFVASEEEN